MKKIAITALILGLLSLAAISFAHWESQMGHGSTASGPCTNLTDLTAEQQQQVDAVKEKYSDQMEELQTSLNSKRDEYLSARTNDSTTVGTLKQLENEITELKQQYWALLSEANKESGGLLAGDSQTWGQCGYHNESNHHNRRRMMGEGRHMGSGHMGRMGQGHMNHLAGQQNSCWRY
ncbi:MAG TPA: hypothetical protein VKN62_04000 [Pelovirga sp.]|nr:hypothetical protein [Pelovirga sp.]